MTIQIFLIRLNQWKPGREAIATKQVEEIVDGEEAQLLECEFERDVNVVEVNDLSALIFIARSVNANDSYVILDPEGLENFSKELISRIALDQKSKIFIMEKTVL